MLPSCVVAVPGQVSLFGHEEPRCDASFARMERIELADGAWLELARGWLAGHEVLFDLLRERTAWRTDERQMYDRRVDVPRLMGTYRLGALPHPVIDAMRVALDARYATAFTRISSALYRDGADSVAWHGDYVARRMDEALVATVSLGSPRRFLVRRKGGGPSTAMALGWGDLVVMGGTCQRTHEHAIPKVARAEPRIALMFRPVWEEP